MHYFVTIILTSITSLRKQLGALHMPPPSSPSNEQRMEEEHGLLLPANMLGMTSGKPRSRNKSNCCIPKYGKARATSRLSTSFPNIIMHMYQCQHVQNMFNINCPTNTRVLVFYLMQSNVPMPDYRPQWPALKQTMAGMVCTINLNKQQHTCYHTIQQLRNELQVSSMALY